MGAIRFLLNGQPHAEDSVSPTTTVLDWLRTRARLTGTKEGCAEGDCGACTVAISRAGARHYEAVNSCLMLLPQLDGCAVMTVEGLASPDGSLHPVQQALVDADATQCGFCTPGFAMSMFAFQQSGEPPEDASIHEALAGNLCRCTGYRSIVDACRKIAPPPLDRHPEVAAQRPSKGDGPGLSSFEARLRLAPQDDGRERVNGYIYGSQMFFAPRTVGELLEARSTYPAAILLAGGTDLGLRVSKDREVWPCVISTAAVEELKQIDDTPGALTLGGAVTYSEALPFIEKHHPSFGALIRRIGSRQIRHLGTFAGNLATASPIGDTLPALIALDAEVLLRSRAGERRMPVERFITGYRKTALTGNEIIAAIRIPSLPSNAQFAVYKLSKRFDQDISCVVAAFRLTQQNGRVAHFDAVFGGIAAQVARAAAVEYAMAGRAWEPESLADAEALLAQDFSPLTDQRASGAYRLRAAAGLLRRFQLETTLGEAALRLEAL